jgi:hypothetical protein
MENRAIIQFWTVCVDNEKFRVQVIREDRIKGGTKSRALIQYLKENFSTDELVFYCAKSSVSQVALAYAVKELKWKIIVFISKTVSLHSHTKQAQYIAGKYLDYKFCSKDGKSGGMFCALENANSYIAINPMKRKLIPLGFHDSNFRNILTEKIRDSFLLEDIGVRSLFLAVGTGNILKCLLNCYKKLIFKIVILGNLFKFNELDMESQKRVIIVGEIQKRNAAIESPAPFKSCREMDAHVWRYVLMHGSQDDYFLNVSK